MSILETKGLCLIYNKGTTEETRAIDDVSISVEPGEILGIIGHTGSGKSTLAQLLNGLLKPAAGKVFLDGEDIWKNPKKIRSVRFQVGLCFQYPEYQLFEETVYKDISFGPKCKGISGDELGKAVREAAEMVGLDDRLLEASPFDLSGGEKRRAAIAGVMAMRPRVLILDEPTAGLDPRGREKILKQVVSYRDQTGSSVILISHSMEDVANTCDRVLVMNKGRVEMLAPTVEVFACAERLCEIGLEVPQVTRIFMELRRRGLDVSPSVFTMGYAKKEAVRLMQR